MITTDVRLLKFNSLHALDVAFRNAIKSSKVNINHPEICNGHTAFLQNDFIKAIWIYNSIAILKKHNGEVYLGLSLSYFYIGDYVQAEEYANTMQFWDQQQLSDHLIDFGLVC